MTGLWCLQKSVHEEVFEIPRNLIWPFLNYWIFTCAKFVDFFIVVCLQVQKLSKGEVLMVNIGSLSTGGRVTAVRADLAKISLTQPVCTEVGEKIALSRRVEKHWRWVFTRMLAVNWSIGCCIFVCLFVCTLRCFGLICRLDLQLKFLLPEIAHLFVNLWL